MSASALPLPAARKSAVIYARVSSKEQGEGGFSIDAQINLLTDYAERNGYTVIRVFTDMESAKEAGRKGFREMLDFLAATPECRSILVEKTDRLTRNFKDYSLLDDLVNQKGIEIRLAKESTALHKDSSASDKFILNIHVSQARYYIDNLSQEVRKGLSQKAQQGYWPTFAPLGYLNQLGDNGKRVIVPDPERAPLICKLFEWYATGNYSIQQVARMAREAGLTFRGSKARLPVSTIHKILRKRVYCGDFDWKGQTFTGNYSPLISRELWNTVQDVLAGRNRRKTRRASREFAFAGLITCGRCGCAMVGEVKKGRYTYYHCTGYKGKHGEPYTREEVLTDRIKAALQGLIIPQDVADWIAAELVHNRAAEKKFHDDAVKRLQDEYGRAQRHFDALYDDKLDGRIDQAFYDRKAAEIKSRQSEINGQIQTHRAATPTLAHEGVKVLELVRRAPVLFESQPPGEKKMLLNFLLSNCVFQGGDLRPTFRKPFDLLVDTHRAHLSSIKAGGGGNGDFEKWRRGRDSNP